MDQKSDPPGSRVGIVPRSAEIAMPKDNVVMIRARVESASPERTQYKPYSTTLVFDDIPALYIEIPVPAEHVRKEKDNLILSLEGWTIFLDVYATAVEKMNNKWVQSFQMLGQHRPY
jgi:hypothetical protein